LQVAYITMGQFEINDSSVRYVIIGPYVENQSANALFVVSYCVIGLLWEILSLTDKGQTKSLLKSNIHQDRPIQHEWFVDSL